MSRTLTRIQATFVETCARRLQNGMEIICIKSDRDRDRAQQTRVAVGTRCHLIHLFALDANTQLQSIFSVDLVKTVPVALGFADNNAKDIIVFGLFDGQMYVPLSQMSQTEPVLISLVSP
jgi:hypothetical protein